MNFIVSICAVWGIASLQRSVIIALWYMSTYNISFRVENYFFNCIGAEELIIVAKCPIFIRAMCE